MRFRLVCLDALLAVVLVGKLSAGAVGQSSSQVTLKTAFNKTLKKTIVVDGAGRTVYIFSADSPDKATCKTYPGCPSVWPAVLGTTRARAGKGIDASLVGTAEGAGGKPQVTYNHLPLYYFDGGIGAGDEKPGDVRGQRLINEWWVVSPEGTPIRG